MAAWDELAAAIDAARLLSPRMSMQRLGIAAEPPVAKAGSKAADELALYSWGEKAYAEEQIIMNAPAVAASQVPDWNELLTAATKGLAEDRHGDLAMEGPARSGPEAVDIEHPI